MSGAESREILEACLARAQSLAAALTQYAWADRVSSATFRMACLVFMHSDAEHLAYGVPRSRSRGWGASGRLRPTGHCPGVRRRCIPTTAWKTPRAVGCWSGWPV
jgi:hypothetical protein